MSDLGRLTQAHAVGAHGLAADPFGPVAPLLPSAAFAEQAYQALRQAILEGRLEPGRRLSVPEVAERLGISRSPAREAITRIAHDGLATMEPRRGAVVACISLESLGEIYEIREVLEGMACRSAAAKITASELTELRRLLVEHHEAIIEDDVERHVVLDQQFHWLIRMISGNHRLIELLDQLQAQIRIAMDMTRHSSGGMIQAHAEHEAILAALAAGSADDAESAARRHVVRLRRGLVAAAVDRDRDQVS